ncbi:hypothetical protein [Hydrogenimonas sp.]
MEARIVKIEIELAKIAQSQRSMDENLKSISSALNKFIELQTSTELLRQKIMVMDKDIAGSFKRAHLRIDKIDRAHTWVVRTIVGAVITSAVGSFYFSINH